VTFWPLFTHDTNLFFFWENRRGRNPYYTNLSDWYFRFYADFSFQATSCLVFQWSGDNPNSLAVAGTSFHSTPIALPPFSCASTFFYTLLIMRVKWNWIGTIHVNMAACFSTLPLELWMREDRWPAAGPSRGLCSLCSVSCIQGSTPSWSASIPSAATQCRGTLSLGA